MIGAEPPALEHKFSQTGERVLQVSGLSLPKEDQFGVTLVDMDLDVRAGEVVGIAGRIGQRAA